MAFKTSPTRTPGIHEINITPFVDVVLVLLVIFMVTAPMMMKDVIGLSLPKSSSSQAQSIGPLSISVTKTGQFLLFGELVDEGTLKDKVSGEKAKDSNVQAVISADVDARHGDVVRALDIVKSSGVENFAIQVEKVSP